VFGVFCSCLLASVNGISLVFGVWLCYDGVFELFFFFESQNFELPVEEGFSVLRSRGVSRAVHLRKVSLAWLLDTVEALILGGVMYFEDYCWVMFETG
jgi:hypothetical protein